MYGLLSSKCTFLSRVPEMLEALMAMETLTPTVTQPCHLNLKPESLSLKPET